MERDKAEQESALSQAHEETQDDAVDHAQLARLVAARHAPAALPAQQTASVMPAPAPMSPSALRPQSSSWKRFLLPALALVILTGISLTLWLSFKPSSKSSFVPPPKGNVSPPNPSPQPSVKAQMIAIPGGTFQMGRRDGPEQEGPPHSVTVAAFFIDNTEVTNAEYAEFVTATGYQPPSHWADGKPLAGQEQWPVTNVSVDDAKAFAAWRSKRDGVTYRLPTEEEWEYAARNGGQNNLYPWGDTWSPDRAAVDEASPKPVGSYPEGKNRWGVLDLVGNVWEWTSSKAAYYPGNSLTVTDWYQDSNVYRGGSYATKTQETQATGTLRNWQKPSTKHPALGFRLIREIK